MYSSIVVIPRSCFNPCCFGSVVPTRTVSDCVVGRKMFQSLLFWISRSDKSLTTDYSFRLTVSILVVLDQSFRRLDYALNLPIQMGFNPCCFGSVVPTLADLSSFDLAFVFQSLLFWISRSDSMLSRFAARLFAFQSLLFWISRSDFTGTGSGKVHIRSFNPCCFGSVVPTRI